MGLSHQFLSQALILEVHLFCVFPAACREFPILNRRGAENLTEGPGGRKGRSGTWNPLILLGCREAGWIGKGLLCKALVYRESLSPDPLPASAGFAETGRGGHATTGVTRPPLALPALSSPHPRTASTACSPALGRPSKGGGGLGNEHLCQVGRRHSKKRGTEAHAPSHPHSTVSNSNASQIRVSFRITWRTC